MTQQTNPTPETDKTILAANVGMDSAQAKIYELAKRIYKSVKMQYLNRQELPDYLLAEITQELDKIMAEIDSAYEKEDVPRFKAAVLMLRYYTPPQSVLDYQAMISNNVTLIKRPKV